MKEYVITVQKELDWDNVPKAHISTYKWAEGGYEPECFGQLALLENGDLCVKMTAYETNPRATYKNFCDPVCCDSCLEFFAALENGSEDYINIEVNPNGTYYASKRRGEETTYFDSILPALPIVKVEKTDTFWSVEYRLTAADLKLLFPNVTLKSGYSFRGNFYKCGDETEIPHYGMWNEITGDLISFHQPKLFGNFTIA